MSGSDWKTYMPGPGEGCSLPYTDSRKVAGHGLDYLVHEYVDQNPFLNRGSSLIDHDPFMTVPAPEGFFLGVVLLCVIVMTRPGPRRV